MARQKKFDYFEAYGQLTAIAVEMSDLMIETFKNYTVAASLPPVLEAMHKLEHKGDLLNHAIFENVATDFMPPIDREDIIDLAHALDNILDDIESTMQHMYMYDVRTMPEQGIAFAELIRKSCEDLNGAMDDFRHFKKSKDFRRHIVAVNDCEEEADKLYLEAMRHLHVEDNVDPMHVLVWSRTYSRMERCADACEHVADLMATIILKNV
jgi:predicted phosphate transport protein (TIGR00153 family)